MRVAPACRPCEKWAMEQEPPETGAESAALIARAALIVAAIALAVAILALFLPIRGD